MMAFFKKPSILIWWSTMAVEKRDVTGIIQT